MFGAAVAVPLILSDALCMSGDPVAISEVICTVFFVSGIVTFLQATFGVRYMYILDLVFTYHVMIVFVPICSVSC